jgi:Icc-related predicted phosphoesterase
MGATSFVALSDTHGMHREVKLPVADVLIHAGDFTGHGKQEQVRDFAAWLKQQPHKYKVVVAGNHDRFVEENPTDARAIFAEAGVRLLMNESVQVEGFKIWGSPITPQFYEWHFMRDRGPDAIGKVWSQIPDDVDILITHGPAYGHGDLAPPYRTDAPKVAGCLDLLVRLRQIKDGPSDRPKGIYPQVHVFGHIHSGYGPTRSDEFPTLFINAATCTEQYRPTNPPIQFKLANRG